MLAILRLKGQSKALGKARLLDAAGWRHSASRAKTGVMNARRQSGTQLLAILALAAIALRALVPAGYMVAADAEAGLLIKICTGDGADRYALFDPETGAHTPVDGPADGHETQDGGEMAPCAFAAASLALASGGVAAELDAPLHAAARLSPPVRGPPLLAISLPSLPARGPPLFA
ncbi:MAG: DUF2946 family protein [Pseudomonadota bacterium]